MHCWASDSLFLPLGPNGLFYYLYSQFLMALVIGPFYPLGFHEWPSTGFIFYNTCLLDSITLEQIFLFIFYGYAQKRNTAY